MCLVCAVIIVKNFWAVCVPTSTWSALGNANRSTTSKYMLFCVCACDFSAYSTNYIDHSICHVIIFTCALVIVYNKI